MTADAILRFQDDNGDHTFLSNFYPSPIEYGFDHITYPTVENFFQAMKLWDPQSPEKREQFSLCTPGQAKRLGRRVELRQDWELIKLTVMSYAITRKFAAGTDLAAMLVETGDAWLEEGNTWGDRYWGTVNRIGDNWLGLILMRQREQLRIGVAE